MGHLNPFTDPDDGAAGLVDQSPLSEAYDTVKVVYNNLTEINQVAAVLDGIDSVVPLLDASAAAVAAAAASEASSVNCYASAGTAEVARAAAEEQANRAEGFALTLETSAAGGFYTSLAEGVADTSIAVGEAFNVIADGRHYVAQKTAADAGVIVVEYNTTGLRDVVSLKDFGAVGTVIADDTAAFEAAKIYMAATGNPVLIPPGTYMTDPFSLDPSAYNAQGFFFGLEAASTIIKRRTTGAGGFVTVGASGGTIFQANLVFRGLTIDGGAKTNGPACVMYDVVRSRFEGVIFKGGSKALHSLGGIANTFDHCNFQDAARGLVVEKFTSSAGGGWPNILRFNNCHFVDNTEWGAWFNDGRMLEVDKCQVEGNGTALGAATGGIYIGPYVGQEVAINDPESIGLIVKDTWFEANRGIADLDIHSGLNFVDGCTFFSQSTMVTHDILVGGGRLVRGTNNMSFPKAANIQISGNGVDTAVPVVSGFNTPLEQAGTDSSGANPTINFGTPFKPGSQPKIHTQVVNISTDTIDQVEVYGISSTGFTMRKKSFNGSVIGTANYTVNWWAVGENP